MSKFSTQANYSKHKVFNDLAIFDANFPLLISSSPESSSASSYLFAHWSPFFIPIHWHSWSRVLYNTVQAPLNTNIFPNRWKGCGAPISCTTSSFGRRNNAGRLLFFWEMKKKKEEKKVKKQRQSEAKRNTSHPSSFLSKTRSTRSFLVEFLQKILVFLSRSRNCEDKEEITIRKRDEDLKVCVQRMMRFRDINWN